MSGFRSKWIVLTNRSTGESDGAYIAIGDVKDLTIDSFSGWLTNRFSWQFGRWQCFVRRLDKLLLNMTGPTQVPD
jgi:hypothetical protein